MNKNRNLMLQAFAGATGTDQINVQAREIDFVSSFSRDLQALLDVMGVTNMVKKENGATLVTRKASGTLESGDVAEGEEIPLSQYTVTETPFDSIKIEKYRKGVTLEAIAEYGYDVAMQKTDDEFKADLQNKVIDKFYTQLKAGTLTGTEATWQMAVAMSIGKVKDKFKKMKKTATGVAVWVNTLDVYKYIGAAEITIQSSFGMDYVTNFMGADVVFISSEIDEGTVIATAINNLIAAYVDPADSEFAQAGLAFTTDGDTGVIGFHSEGTYGRMIADNFAIIGLRIYCEYLDAVAVMSVTGA
jgi:hypothetical protein